MRGLFVIIVCLACSAGGIGVLGEEKVAEGIYELHGASGVTPDSRWVLYAESSRGYHLESEIQGMTDGKRLVQTEELDNRLIPTKIGYSTYVKNLKKPTSTVSCKFTDHTITCDAVAGGKAVRSKSFGYKGPFWIWLDNLVDVDLSWLLTGAVNMSGLEREKTTVSVIRVFDDENGQIDFNVDEEDPLEFLREEKLEFNGTPVAVRHYKYATHDELWIADSGILIKSSHEGKDNYVLTAYKQYKKLIPELRVDKPDERGR